MLSRLLILLRLISLVDFTSKIVLTIVDKSLIKIFSTFDP